MGRSVDMCIVGGCGHVGLPLALVFAQAGCRVGIFDVDEEEIEAVRAGRMPFLERGAPDLLAEALRLDRLELSSDPSLIKQSGVVVVVVGTPVDEFLQPSLRVFEGVIDEIAPWLSEDALVVLRSTAFPGTTAWVSRALAERGVVREVVFCPERIAEGRAIEELTTLPQIIGASTERGAERAEALFARLSVKTMRTSPEEAELAKLFTNAWRYLKFAVANQFFMIASEAGADYVRILDAVRRDYPRAQELPGPGFAAGPCLLKDTMQLSSFTGSNFVLGHAAMLVNEGLPEFIFRSLQQEVDLSRMTVAILGMAFKANSDDARAALSYKLKKLLWFAGARVLCSDPYVDDPELVSLEQALDEAELVVVGVPHRDYRDLDLSGRQVYDLWGVTGRKVGLR